MNAVAGGGEARQTAVRADGGRPLRLLFVTGSLEHGGAERHSVALMSRLADRGHECHAVYVRPKEVEIPVPDGLAVHALDGRGYLDIAAVRRFAALLSGFAPHVILAANPYALLHCWVARRLSGVRPPLVVTYHTTQLRRFKERLQMLFYRPLFWGADCSIFVSELQRRYCVRRAVFARRNLTIHNGVDTAHFAAPGNAEARSRTRRALGLADDDYVIGVCALLRPEKNHTQLVDALALLRRQGVRARALMIGDGEMRGAVCERARAAGLERDVVITGVQQDVRPFVSACDVIAVCSTAVETFSLAALEAMALERPLVHADLGGAREMVRPGWNGFLFPPGDTRALVRCLAVLADRPLAARMGRHARMVVRTQFSEETMVDHYEAVLREVAGATRASAGDGEADPRGRGRQRHTGPAGAWPRGTS